MIEFRRREPIASGSTTVDSNPLLDRLYRARGISDPSELDYSSAGLLRPDSLKGIETGCDLLEDAIRTDKRILVISDYDCDGATACAIAVDGLRILGGKNVDFLVPSRFEHGYGLSPSVVELAAERRPDLIVTVDNGISSVAGAQAIRDLPWDCKLLVTDHHLAPEVLPDADAIINPNQPGCEFPSKAIAGCGVMFYTLWALRERLMKTGFYPKGAAPSIAPLLDLVAVGTVADVVPLDHNNRTLVHAGLQRINRGDVRPGIQALLEVAKRRIGAIVSSDFGFGVGPRINAAGRLDDMTTGIRCLLATEPMEAMALATELDDLNKERKELEQQMKDDAMVGIDIEEDDRFGVCVFEEHFHQGVVGIVASRLKDKLFRPVIVFAPSGDDAMTGSARSVPGCHLRDALAAIDAKNPGLIIKFGGHAAAAGLSIKRADFDRFARLFDAEIASILKPEDLQGKIDTDGELSPDEITLDNAEALTVAGPWGQAFPEPVFDGVFEVMDKRVLADRHLKLVLRHPEGGDTVEAIAFNAVEDGVVPENQHMHLAYRLSVNEYRGRRSLQLMVQHLQEPEEPAPRNRREPQALGM